jgi:hypothetical protein
MPIDKKTADEFIREWTHSTNPCNEIELPILSTNLFKELENYTFEGLGETPQALTRKVLIEKVEKNVWNWNINLENLILPNYDSIMKSYLIFNTLRQDEIRKNTVEAIDIFKKGLEENRAERKVLIEKNDIFKTWINDAENDVLPLE